MTTLEGGVIINHIHLFQLYQASKQWVSTYPENPNVPHVIAACMAAEAVLYPNYKAEYKSEQEM